MKEKDMNRLRRDGPKWLSAAIAFVWVFIAWYLQYSIMIVSLTIDPASCTHPLWQVSPISSAFVSFFSLGVPALVLAVLVLVKDRYLDERRCRLWNIVFILTLVALIVFGNRAIDSLHQSWGVLTYQVPNQQIQAIAAARGSA